MGKLKYVIKLYLMMIIFKKILNSHEIVYLPHDAISLSVRHLKKSMPIASYRSPFKMINILSDGSNM